MELEKFGTAGDIQELLAIREEIESLSSAHVQRDAVTARVLDRADVEHLGAGPGEFEHLLARDPVELVRLRDDPGVAISFLRDGAGGVTGLRIEQAGSTFDLPRGEPEPEPQPPRTKD